MTFSTYTYTRPDYEAHKAKLTDLIAEVANAADAETAKTAVEAIVAAENTIQTHNTLWSIRHSIDMNDEFYNEETKFWNEFGPLFDEVTNEAYKVILASPFRAEFSDILPETFFMLAENKAKIFSSEIIPLLQKENELQDQYSKLIASAKLDFQGQTYNLPQLIPFYEETNRQVRKEATDTRAAFFQDNQAEFDRIYDDMVKVRHEIATKLGFKDYVEYGYLAMNRLDYNRDMVKVYREEILKHVVPVVQELRHRQAKRIGVDKLEAHDFAFEFPNGNAKPQGSYEDIISHAQHMYRDLSPETGEFFDFMVDKDLLDLVAKTGKNSGGYCTYIPDYKSPFIFSNFNGTSGDIDVLTHEAGHAFQVYRSRWIKPVEVLWPTYETCEIHSMSMEFITWPYMEGFFGAQTAKYKFSHLASTLLFLPYGVLVDHFQHEVYENPHMTREERRATWTRLRNLYMPDRPQDDALFWFAQGHLFSAPFYYIDYTLAQVCALQFWKRTQIDHDPSAWADYLHICDLGGSKTFLQVVAAAKLQSPFEPGALEGTVKAAKAYLDAVDDMNL